MSVYDYKELRSHLGHRVVVVGYGDPIDPENVAIECEDCNVVLLDFDRDEEEDE
jgi:hypothetical protein